MAKKEYNLKLAVFLRWARSFVPQVPAIAAYLADKAGALNLPEWVVPTLVFVGAVATALDKYLRSMGK